MRLKRWLAGVVFGLAASSLAMPADNVGPMRTITWKKTVVDRVFRSEGVAIADVNRDGKVDILAGDVWYEAPDWKMHEIRKVGDYGNGLASYSECMLCWADDINGDGWTDLIVVDFPGKETWWWENPGPGHYDPAVSVEIAKLSVTYRDRGVVAFDLAGGEAGRPQGMHQAAFDIAADG